MQDLQATMQTFQKTTEIRMDSLQSTMQDLAEYIKLAHQRIEKIEK